MAFEQQIRPTPNGAVFVAETVTDTLTAEQALDFAEQYEAMALNGKLVNPIAALTHAYSLLDLACNGGGENQRQVRT
ncbi:hypothetical protein HY357_01850 [Candidatus Roizmanbacteria bacterium]|nr:hypothetical protein [Candidatus Roizmanbacteria bacterium]